jgi:molybdenum cofactor guanylyltransferase
MTATAARVAAAIFAGGRGRRMGGGLGDGRSGGARARARAGDGIGAGIDGGITKGWLVVEGQRIIDRQLAVLRPRFAEVVIAANDPAPWAGLGLRVIPDRVDGGIGPLAGLDAVLADLADDLDAVVCVASDMPFLSPGVVELLRDGAPGAPALAPRIAGRPEPLLARYARGIASTVGDQIARGDYAMIDLLARVNVTWIEEPELRRRDPELRSLINVNTPADLARLAPARGS